MSENKCRKYNEPILPDEKGNCSLCGVALDFFGNEFPDEISISWCVEDIKGWDIDNPEEGVAPITDNEARRALSEIKHNHDCEFGITWETIGSAVRDIRDNREK
jgi:hypothetical protein